MLDLMAKTGVKDVRLSRLCGLVHPAYPDLATQTEESAERCAY